MVQKCRNGESSLHFDRHMLAVQILNNLINCRYQVIIVVLKLKISKSAIDPACSRDQKRTLAIKFWPSIVLDYHLHHLHHVLLVIPDATVSEVSKSIKQSLSRVVRFLHLFEIGHDGAHVTLEMHWSKLGLSLSESERAHLLYKH